MYLNRRVSEKEKNIRINTFQAIASRLEEMLNKDEEYVPQVITLMSDENKHAELLAEDEEEDFLDEGTLRRFFSFYYLHTYSMVFGDIRPYNTRIMYSRYVYVSSKRIFFVCIVSFTFFKITFYFSIF